MSNHNVDLLVIGCGASGASVAYEATRRGLSVAVLEAGDIGGGTSCRSTKLLHGGVRYLELAFKTFDLAQLQLVREALMERSHWLEQAPFLAKRLELALPTSSLWGQGYYGVGLGLYDALAGRRSIGKSRLLSRQQLETALPQLKTCQGAVAYSDGQFDDARLNLLLARTAEQGGAVLRTRCRVVGIEQHNNGMVRAAISENAAGLQERWNASVIVNATGISGDALRQLAQPDSTTRLLTSRGTHIVLADNLCPEGVGLLVPSTRDGRVLFMLPFYGRTLVGTTDETCDQQDASAPSEQEVQYLMAYVQEWFPQSGKPAVTSRWAGGRPLLKPAGDDRNSSRVVREHEVETLSCGLISVLGGKWTTCRPMALDTLAAVERQLGRTLPPAISMPLLGSADVTASIAPGLRDQAKRLQDVLPDSTLQAAQISHLQHNHGLQALPLIEGASSKELEPLSAVIPVCKAELRHGIRSEHARSSTDVLARRCRLAMVDHEEAERLRPIVDTLLDEEGLTIQAKEAINLSLNA